MTPDFATFEPSERLPVPFRSAASATISCEQIAVLAAAWDSVWVLAAGMVTPLLYAGLFHAPIPASWDKAAGFGILAAGLYVLTARSAGLYRLPVLLDPEASIKPIVSCCCVAVISLIGILFCIKSGTFSRGALATFAGTLVLGCGLARVTASRVVGSLSAGGVITGRPILLLGDAPELAGLDASYLLDHYGLHDVARLSLDDDPDGRFLAEAPRLARAIGAEGFLIATAGSSGDRLTRIERSLRTSPLPAWLMPNAELRAVIDRASRTDLRTRHLVTLQQAPMSRLERLAKATSDRLIAAITLLFVAPILVGAALAIKLESPGPVLFRQRRSGFDQRQFTILKFRTMAANSDPVKQAQKGDRRITRVGAFLRRSSIDELPQLFNVLRGDMALVGPRPHALAHDQQYRALIGDYQLRHRVKPGLTGWAQVLGHRGETARPDDMSRRIELDIWYIANWSFTLDLTILFRTVFEVCKLNAY